MNYGKKLILTSKLIENKIYYIRNQKVMIDSDLAELYGVETKALNQAVLRNPGRFPVDFRFQLTEVVLNNDDIPKIFSVLKQLLNPPPVKRNKIGFVK